MVSQDSRQAPRDRLLALHHSPSADSSVGSRSAMVGDGDESVIRPVLALWMDLNPVLVIYGIEVVAEKN
jgi:hypothetical protein